MSVFWSVGVLLAVSFVSFVLGGLTATTYTEPEHYERGIEYCDPHEGLDKIAVTIVPSVVFHCANGVTHTQR